MNRSFTRRLSKLNFSKLSDGSLANYAYSISRCKFPASVNIDKFHQEVARLCDDKIKELVREVERRIGVDGKNATIEYALTVCLNPDAYCDNSIKQLLRFFKRRSKKSIVEPFGKMISNIDYARLSDTELVMLHSLSPVWCDYRRLKDMEIFTRTYFWSIVRYIKDRYLADVLLLTEYLEAENYSQLINLRYRFGERVDSIHLSEYTDCEIANRIATLAGNLTFTAREELIAIADYIQTDIIEKDDSAEHLHLLNAILSVNLHPFSYPKIVKALEQIVNEQEESNFMSLIELAPIFKTLWKHTAKYKYFSRLKKVVRGCYLTLAGRHTFPDFSIEEPNSSDIAIRILNDNPDIMWAINGSCDIDKLIREYQLCAI